MRTPHHRLPSLDHATTMAVVEQKEALRAVRALERRFRTEVLSPAARRVLLDKLDEQRWRLREARLGLDRLLEDEG
jgi:hypothetical protein